MKKSLYEIPKGCTCHGDALMGMRCESKEHARLKSPPPLVVFNREPYRHSFRCVHCGRDGTQHDFQTNLCPGSSGAAGKTFATMNLPHGETCGDCIHIRRCNAMFGHMAADEQCDWYPIRFLAALQSPAPPSGMDSGAQGQTESRISSTDNSALPE